MELRPYQRECLDIINNTENGSWLVVLATGLGKTVIFTHIKRKGRVLILSHREELVYQPRKYYEDTAFGVERAGETSNGEEIVSASVQTLVKRLDKFSPDDFDMIITDEAHHAVAPSYRKIYHYFKPRLHIGFTATPKRADDIGLNKIFQGILYEKNLQWGIENGYLCNLICRKINIGYDLEEVTVKSNDYKCSDLDKAVNREKMNMGIAMAYKETAVGQTIIFTVGKKHSKNITKRINEICGDATAEAITSDTEKREDILERFRKKEINCLVNCMVLTEGTDLPMVETVMIARPTENIGLYTQMVGRALRLFEGKQNAYVIDCIGNEIEISQCTASDLIGLDLEEVPKDRRNKVEGSLLELEEVIDDLIYEPEKFVVTYEDIMVFMQGERVNILGISYIKLADGSYHCQIGNNRSLFITKPSKKGKCRILLQYSDGSMEEMTKADGYDKAFEYVKDYLKKNDKDNAYIWCAGYRKNWTAGKKITEQQESMLKNLCNESWFQKRYSGQNIEIGKLSKDKASTLIDRILLEKRKENNISKASAV